MAELGVIALHSAMHAPATWEYEMRSCSFSVVRPAIPVNCNDCASQPLLPSARAPLARLNVSSMRAGTSAIVTSADVGADSYIHVNICISGTFPRSVVSEMRHIRGLRAGLHCLDYASMIVGVRIGL